MFQGIVEWSAEVPEGTSKVSLYTPRSIQTTEWREDLALEIFDEADAVVGRFIAYETETDLGHLDPGKYRFRLSYPSLGAAALHARFAGSELRFYDSPGKMTLYPNLTSAIAESGASSRMNIPFGGARSVFARLPELEALENGQRYFGSVSVKSGDHTLLSVPLSIARPTAPQTGPNDWALTEADEPCEEHAKWSEAKSAGETKPVAWISAARDWASAEPLNFEATLAVYEALVSAGLPEVAKRDAVGFLASFPNRVEEFRAAAKSWN